MGCSSNCGTCNDCCGGLTLPQGPAGLDGQNAFTVTTADFTQPSVGATVTVNVSALGQYTGLWAAAGQTIFIEGGGDYEVVSSTSTTVTVENLGGSGNASPAATVSFPAKVSPSGKPGSTGATGAAGVDGTVILVNSMNNATYSSTSYTSLIGTHAIPADTWENVGDTLSLRFFIHTNGGGTGTDFYMYNAKITIGSTDIKIGHFFSAVTEYLLPSWWNSPSGFLNGHLIEIDLVADVMSPFRIVAVTKVNGSIFTTPGISLYAQNGNFSYYIPTGSALFALSTDAETFSYDGTSNSFTTGIDPTISNNLVLSAKATQNGTGGGVTPLYACPKFVAKRFKKV